MTKPILFFDFDRTLFETDRFIEDTWYAVSRHYGIDAEEALAEVEEWYERAGQLHTYRFDRHVATKLERPLDEIAEVIRAELGQGDYVYDDTAVIDSYRLAYEVRIMTFGRPWWQQFKMTFAEPFSDLPVDITMHSKHYAIRQGYAGTTGWLIDDVLDTNLPASYRQVWLQRGAGSSRVSGNPQVIVAHSLHELTKIL